MLKRLRQRFQKNDIKSFSIEDLLDQEIKLSGTIPEGFEEVEKYWLEKPFSAAVIAVNKDKGYFYCVLEPEITEDRIDLRKVRQEVLELVPRFTSDDDIKTLFNAFRKLAQENGLDIDKASKIWYYLSRDALRAGRITPMLHDPHIEDISCSGYGKPVFVYHRQYESMPTNVIMGEDELDDFVLAVSQKKGVELSVANPSVDTVLYDGSRIQLTFRDEVSDHGSTFSVRKVKNEPITPISLLNWGTFSHEEMAFLWLCLESNSSILFAGGTAGGKTTAMNAVALFIPPNAKVVSIEDTREVILPHRNWIPGIAGTRADMFSLLKSALRQRPDYIIVGEVRGKEVEVMFQAMSLGHSCLSTIHGGSVEAVLDRITNPPLSVPKVMLNHLDLIAFIGRYHIGKKIVRKCAGIWELSGEDSSEVEAVPVFRWDAKKDAHTKAHMKIVTPHIIDKIAWRRGWARKDVINEIERRTEVLKYLSESGMADSGSFCEIVSRYYFSPEDVLNSLAGTKTADYIP